jgi:hypothetical protein
MLSARMIRMIEEHASELTRAVLDDLTSDPRTPSYHGIPRDELQRRVYDVYHNLGRWLGHRSDGPIEAHYAPLGKQRRSEGVPLSEVVCALILEKEHLHAYVRRSGLVDSAVELYSEEELNLMLDRFFDKALYHTVRGYEGERPAGR